MMADVFTAVSELCNLVPRSVLATRIT